MFCFGFLQLKILSNSPSIFAVICGLEVCYVVSTYEDFPGAFLLLLSNLIVAREHVLYNLNLLKFIEACFVA